MNDLNKCTQRKVGTVNRMVRVMCYAALMLAGVGIPTVTLGADPSVEQVINSTVPTIFLNSGAPGMVIAIVRKGDLIIQGYGETSAGNGQKPSAISLVRVGSISKVLATDLMVKLAKERKLRLSDPLQMYAPAGSRVPSLDRDRPITLLDLATHTSGLSRSVSGQPPRGAPPFTWPDKAARWNWLVKQKLISIPGSAALYSNVAYDLLVDAIEVAGKKPYSELFRKKTAEPLGMRDTTATPNKEQCARLMVGTGADPPGPCADTRATAGSGGMYSTAADMGAWMQYLLGVKTGNSSAQRSIAQAIYVQRQALSSIEGLDIAGRASGLGLGWVLLAPTSNTPAILQKTGAGGGFMSYMALVPGRQVGAFVALTKVDFDMFYAFASAVNGLVASLDPR